MKYVNNLYTLDKLLYTIKNIKKFNFIESIELSIKFKYIDKYISNLKNKYLLRYTSFPYGNGKKLSIGIIVNEYDYELAKKLDVDFYYKDDLIDKLNNKKKIIDILLLSDNAINLFNNYYKEILESKNIILNKNTNTITSDIEKSIKLAKLGQSFFKIDKNLLLNISIGKINFNIDFLIVNIKYLFKSLEKIFINYNINKIIDRIYICSSMSKSIEINKYNLLEILKN